MHKDVKKIHRKKPFNKINSTIIIASLILFIVNTGVYWKSRNFDFVWDDHRTHIHNNQNLMQDNTAEFWKKPYTGLYIPVSYTTWNWIKDFSLKEVRGRKVPDPKTFHTVNIFLHAINAILVLYFLYLLTGAGWFSFAGALLFSIHPMQVETVVWISEYRGLLATFFSLLAIILYFIYRKKENKEKILLLGTTLLFILALLSKPSAIVLPLIVVAMEFFIFRGNKSKYLTPLIWFLITIPVMWITKSSQPGAENEFAAPLWARPFIAGDSFSFYTFKFLLPVELSASYGRTPEAVMNEWYFYLLWLVPAALLFLIWKLKDKEPLIAFGTFIFLVVLLPVSGLLNFDFQKFSTVADRYLYFSIIGAAIVLAGLFQKLNKHTWVYYASGAIAIIYFFVNINQQQIWKDDFTLWRATAERNPGQPHVYNNYGITLHDAGRYDEAIKQYDIVLQARPMFASAYNNRGNSYAFKRDFRKALADQTKAIEIDPGFGRAWFNRSVTHFQLGNLQQALHDLEQAEKTGYRAHPQYRMDLERELKK